MSLTGRAVALAARLAALAVQVLALEAGALAAVRALAPAAWVAALELQGVFLTVWPLRLPV